MRWATSLMMKGLVKGRWREDVLATVESSVLGIVAAVGAGETKVELGVDADFRVGVGDEMSGRVSS